MRFSCFDYPREHGAGASDGEREAVILQVDPGADAMPLTGDGDRWSA
ncbi:hypothetical protein FM103_16180 [Corynebacterium xerosis]|nr:hypothetical protein FM103_16180 [Corynebacterium xerosis]